MESEKFKTKRAEEAEQNQEEALDLSLDEKEHIHTVISALREPILKMIKPVLANIEAGDYQVLIGDDASGRIPALIVRTVISGIYAKNGHQNIQTRFIAGTRGYRNCPPYKKVFIEKNEKVAQYIQDISASIPNMKNALIVTDTIASGKSLTPVVESLKKSGIIYDILTVGDEIGSDKYNDMVIKRLGRPFFSGQHKTPLIYSEPSISGVEKDPKNLHAIPTIKNIFSPEDSIHERKKIALAREEAKKVASDILASYESRS